jgi:hypothetical protein
MPMLPGYPRYRPRSFAALAPLGMATGASLILAAPLPAQAPVAAEPAPPTRHAYVLAANVALGGLTAGVRQWRNDGSFLDGFWRGAVGGFATYGGKVMVTADAPGAGTAGRIVAAVGASVSRNAAEGLPTFHRLVLPLGPVRLHWQPATGEVRPSVDVVGTVVLAVSVAGRDGARLHLGHSLASAAPVFSARNWNRDDYHWHARHLAGTIVLGGGDAAHDGYDRFRSRLLAHERVHVLQYDQAWILWGDPLEKNVLAAIGVPDGIARVLDLSMHTPLLIGLRHTLSYADRPWELEAHLLSRTWRDASGF